MSYFDESWHCCKIVMQMFDFHLIWSCQISSFLLTQYNRCRLLELITDFGNVVLKLPSSQFCTFWQWWNIRWGLSRLFLHAHISISMNKFVFLTFLVIHYQGCIVFNPFLFFFIVIYINQVSTSGGCLNVWNYASLYSFVKHKVNAAPRSRASGKRDDVFANIL